MKATITAMTALAALSTSALAAEEAVPAPPFRISGSATLVSDYLFKGMTQTWSKPAAQGSIDLTTDMGFSASIWASNVSSKVYAGASTEIDLSVGYKKSLSDDWTVGTGLLWVYYPSGNYNKVRYTSLPSQRYDFAEANLFVSYKWLSLKYSRTLTDLLGFNEKTGYTGGTRGSSYIDLSADIPISDNYVLNLHAGHQNVTARLVAPTANGSRNPNFQDYRIGVTRNFPEGLSVSLGMAWNSNTAFFNGTPSNRDSSDTKDVGKHRVFVSATKMF